MSVLIRRPWTRQPPWPTAVDASSPLHPGPQGIVELRGQPYDLTTGYLGVRLATSESQVTTTVGVGARLSGGSLSNAGHSYSGKLIAGLTDVTFAFVLQVPTNNPNATMVMATTSTDLSGGVRIQAPSGSPTQMHFTKGGIADLNAITLTAGEQYHVIASLQGTNAYYIKARSLKTGTITETSGTNGSTPNASSGAVVIGGDNQVHAYNGVILLGYFSPQYRDPAWADAWLARGPWHVFEPQKVPRLLAPAAGGVTGTLATTNANDTSSASGTTTIVGTLAKTNANDTSSASGTTTVVGTLAKTNANDTVSAAGTTTVTGSLATANANDAAAAAGTTTVTGTVVYTNANDTVSAVGDAGAPDPVVETTRRRGGGGPVNRFVQGRKDILLRSLLEYLTEEKPEEEAKQVIKAVRNGKPIPRTEAVMEAVASMPEMTAEELAARIIPSRLESLKGDLASLDTQRVVRRALKIARDRDDEDIMMLL